jgi:23S rRNA (cytosine1962-C5)-methyltransferase
MSTRSDVIPVVSLKGRERRGHPWIFSNEIDSPRELVPGGVVDVVDSGGRWIGRGFGHPNSLICIRIARRDRGELDGDWLLARLRAALKRRTATCPGRTAYRWVHSEADGIPGLIVDRYGDRVVLVANTVAMDQRRDLILAAVREVAPDLRGGLWRCDGRGRELEGLPAFVEPAWGDAQSPWTIDDDGLSITFDPAGGQKTGLFLDMWDNRRRMAPALGSGRVADLFCYVGQWGLYAARMGAEEVICVDRSEDALRWVAHNADGAVRTERAPVDRWLDEQPDGSFDGIVCDPPSFIRSRKQAGKGARAYSKIFAKVLRKIRPGGYAVLASCSHHLFEDRFERALQEAARSARREVVTVIRGGQAPCHPVPLAFPEARYLKTVLVEVR